MSKPTRRQGSAVYYARRVVPKDVREAVGRAQIWKSLGTTDLEAAKPLERLQQLSWDREFEAHRKRATASTQPSPSARWLAMTPEQQAAVRDAQHEREVAEMEYQWSNPLPDYEDLSPEEQRIQDRIDEARERWEENQRQDRIFLAQERAAEKANGQLAAPPATGTSLQAMVDRWERERKPDAKTVDRMKAVVSWFEDHAGRLPIEEITPENVQTWSDKLLQVTSPANARTKLANFNTLMRFAVRRARVITVNPASDISIEVKRDPEDQVQPFDLPALQAIFGSPVYAEGIRPRAGSGEAAYWLPLLALYTGARLNELGQLRPKDILQHPYVDRDGEEQQAWLIRIVADKADGLKLKNAWSARRVPIHAELVRLGFLAYVDSVRAAHQGRLFPELRPDKYGTITANWSKWFGRYLRETCNVTDDRMRFHSFRHAFKDYAREAEIAEDVNDAFTGHKGEAIARQYGSSLNYPLRPMVAAMADYRVTGLILPAPSQTAEARPDK